MELQKEQRSGALDQHVELQNKQNSEPLVELFALRKERAELKAQLAAETARLERAATRATAESEQQRQEILRLQMQVQSSDKEAGNIVTDGAPVELVEAFQELERLELALVQERQRGVQVNEEKLAAEESHARDVDMLEKMLQQIIAENGSLAGRLAAWEASKLEGGTTDNSEADIAQHAAEKLAGGTGGSDMDEPEMEHAP